MRRVLLIPVCIVALVAIARPAHALDVYGVDLRLGVRGGPNIAMLPKPDDYSDYGDATPYEFAYGTGWNAGVNLAVRAFDIASLELGWMRAHEHVASNAFELDGVLDCSSGRVRCPKQTLGYEMGFDANHFPIAIRLEVPTGVARPFITAGLDFVTGRTNREFNVVATDPFPENLDPETQGELIDRYAASAEYNYARNAVLNEDAPTSYTGIIAGIGLNMALDKIEVPVEFRLNLYPASGQHLNQRGVFPPRGLTAYDPRITVEYNDVWRMQIFVLFGLDYLIL
ncbi:MAG: hypothetical protein H6698_00975 [Myxococcales bacterium]|nr:hypothetical protein [Myxococcales bacterium]MCB9530963.1 hypothetical protein [Myxococcales bacterium]MCB9532883.1 hypothetical protein [Myxococcales bacterium]